MDMMVLNVKNAQLIVQLVIQLLIVWLVNLVLLCLMVHVLDVEPNVQFVNSILMKLNNLLLIDV